MEGHRLASVRHAKKEPPPHPASEHTLACRKMTSLASYRTASSAPHSWNRSEVDIRAVNTHKSPRCTQCHKMRCHNPRQCSRRYGLRPTPPPCTYGTGQRCALWRKAGPPSCRAPPGHRCSGTLSGPAPTHAQGPLPVRRACRVEAASAHTGALCTQTRPAVTPRTRADHFHV